MWVAPSFSHLLRASSRRTVTTCWISGSVAARSRLKKGPWMPCRPPNPSQQLLVGRDQVVLIVIKHIDHAEILQLDRPVLLEDPVPEGDKFVILEGSAQHWQWGTWRIVPCYPARSGPTRCVDLFNTSSHETLNKLALEKQKAHKKRPGGHQRGGVDHRPLNPGLGHGEDRQGRPSEGGFGPSW